MAIVKNKTTAADREFWSHIETVAQEVNEWPDWIAHRPAAQQENQNGTETTRCGAHDGENREPRE